MDESTKVVNPLRNKSTVGSNGSSDIYIAPRDADYVETADMSTSTHSGIHLPSVTRGGNDVITNDKPPTVYTLQTWTRLIVIHNRATTVAVYHHRDLPQTGVCRRQSPP